jgi:hypothetical protein
MVPPIGSEKLTRTIYVYQIYILRQVENLCASC